MTSKTKYEAFGVSGYAWSTMKCWNPGSDKDVDHPPHVWDSQHMSYGPYWCGGKNPTWQFKDKDIVSTSSGDASVIRLNGTWHALTPVHSTDASLGVVVGSGFAKLVRGG